MPERLSGRSLQCEERMHLRWSERGALILAFIFIRFSFVFSILMFTNPTILCKYSFTLFWAFDDFYI